MSVPVRRRRLRPLLLAFGALVLVAALGLTAVAGPGVTCGSISLDFGTPTYANAAARTAEWGATQDGYSDAQIDAIAASNSDFFIPKFAEGFDVVKQFEDVRRLKASAAKQGRTLRVMMYINAQYWLSVNDDAWQPYAASFEPSFLLKDAGGAKVPFYGLQGTQNGGDRTLGYTLDLADPGYRAWILGVALDWLKQAPLDGVVFDEANPLLGDQKIRKSSGDGAAVVNDLLCGKHAPVDADGDCDRVVAWNDGLADTLKGVTDAFRPLGKQVIYNGVAASQLRENRNVGLLEVTDGASNEAFCYSPSVVKPTEEQFRPFADDAAMMQQVAQDGRRLFEITNYQTPQRQPFGDYCLAGFLMGWQPGSSFLIYHESYADLASGGPQLAEQRLNLGEPTTTGYDTTGSVLSRTFQRGFVAVNAGDETAKFVAPRNGSQYRAGELVGRIGAGAELTMPPRSAVFFLDAPAVPGAGKLLGIC